MKYFKDVNDLQELRKQYKDLLKKYHPDNANGSTEATQEINAEYDQLFKLLKDKHDSKSDKSADNKENNAKIDFNNMKYDFSEDIKLRKMLQKVIHLSDITLEIIGNWLWISGNTYQYKKELKDLGFKFAGQKRSWYWHSEAFRKRSHKSLSMEDIRNYYGSRNGRHEETETSVATSKKIGCNQLERLHPDKKNIRKGRYKRHDYKRTI